jgi:hypothetical protein
VGGQARVELSGVGRTPGVEVSQRLGGGVWPLRCEVVEGAQRVLQQVLDPVGDDVLEEGTGVVVFPFVEGGVVAGLGGLVVACSRPPAVARGDVPGEAGCAAGPPSRGGAVEELAEG